MFPFDYVIMNIQIWDYSHILNSHTRVLLFLLLQAISLYNTQTRIKFEHKWPDIHWIAI